MVVQDICILIDKKYLNINSGTSGRLGDAEQKAIKLILRNFLRIRNTDINSDELDRTTMGTGNIGIWINEHFYERWMMW